MALDIQEELELMSLITESEKIDSIQTNIRVYDLCKEILDHRLSLNLSDQKDGVENYLYLIFVGFIAGVDQGTKQAIQDIGSKLNPQTPGHRILMFSANVLFHLMINGELNPAYICEQLTGIIEACADNAETPKSDVQAALSIIKFSEAVMELTVLAERQDSDAVRQSCVRIMQDAVITSSGTKLEKMLSIGKMAVYMFIRKISPGNCTYISNSLN